MYVVPGRSGNHGFVTRGAQPGPPAPAVAPDPARARRQTQARASFADTELVPRRDRGDAAVGRIDADLVAADVHEVDHTVAGPLEIGLAERAGRSALSGRVRLGQGDLRLGQE